MSVSNGQLANASTFNSAFASKSADNTMTGKQNFTNGGSAPINDVQKKINDIEASDALKIPIAQKDQPNGVPSLDGSGIIPVSEIPDILSSKVIDFNTACDSRITIQKGAPNGLAPLDGSGLIDSVYLPSYVDDVLEYADFASFPVTGETGKIYVAKDTNLIYRWSGSSYIQVSEGIPTSYIDTDGTLSANSDTKLATQKATKTYVDSIMNPIVAALVFG